METLVLMSPMWATETGSEEDEGQKKTRKGKEKYKGTVSLEEGG